MNSQSKWKKAQNENNGNSASSKFVSLIYKDDESETFEIKNDNYTGTAQQPIRSFPSNVLNNNTKHNTLDNYRSITNVYSPMRQYQELSHHNSIANDPCSSSSMSHANAMLHPRTKNRTDVENLNYRNSSIFATSGGIMHVSLRNGVRIDITVDNSIRLTSCAGQIVISLSNLGEAAAIKHPNGMVQQTDKFVQIIAHDESKLNQFTRYANMCVNGISFTSSKLSDVFVLDSIGTRQSRKSFLKLTGDHTSSVFLSKSKHGPTYNNEASQFIQKASVKKCPEDGMDVITINDYRIWQMKDGLVTVARMSFPFKIRASPMNCSFTLSTPHIHCTASSRDSAHLFVRCQDQSMHYDGTNFVVRYNGNSAGFDKNDYLIVY